MKYIASVSFGKDSLAMLFFENMGFKASYKYDDNSQYDTVEGFSFKW